jgi:thiol:disulfide interchange protein DsbD
LGSFNIPASYLGQSLAPVLGENRTMWIRVCQWLMCAALLCCVPVRAQTSFHTPQVRAELTWHAPQGIQADQPLYLGLVLQHQPQWHTYWLNPGDSGLPTAFEWQLPEGVRAGDTLWPVPQKLRLGDLVNYGFEGRVTLVVPLMLSNAVIQAHQASIPIRLTAHWLVCRTECIPQSGEFQMNLPLQANGNRIDPLVQTTLEAQPQTFPGTASARIEQGRLVLQAAGWPADAVGQKVSVFPEQKEVIAAPAETHPRSLTSWQDSNWQARLPLSAMRSTAPEQLSWWWVVGEGAKARAWRVQTKVQGSWPPLPLPAADAPALTPVEPIAGLDLGWWGALIGAFLGGVLLNLMPCVLPVLALKVFALVQGHETPAMRRRQAWAYTLGVMLFLLGLGATLLALRAAGEAVGWGFQLQSPWVVAALALLFALIALNLMGWVDPSRWFPAGWGQWSSRHPTMDAFLTGLLSVLVAAPCSAPFMGASLGLAVTLPWHQAMAVFAMLGIGLAGPYGLVAHFPVLARWVPRPGRWMNRLRQWLALPMAATVLWLLWVLGQQITALDAGRQTPAQTAHADSEAAVWWPWSAEVADQAQAKGRMVFVDFTAAWCITCQVNERAVLQRSEVLEAFKQKNVLTLRADWTRHDPAITQALSDLNRTGIPVYVIYQAGAQPKVLSELISVNDVLTALK